MEPQGTVTIKAGKDKKIHAFYPWVQRGELTGVDGDPSDGAVVRLVDANGDFLAVGTYNSQSRFPFRVLSLADESIDQRFFVKRLLAAKAMRDATIEDTNARRLMFAEADGVPGLIVDDYDGYLVVQVRSMGIECLRELWLPAMIEAYQPKAIYERSEMEGRREEGLEPLSAALMGEMPETVMIEESGLKFIVPIREGLKTGYYLDQRQTRRVLAQRVKPGQRLLDCFCYTGAFSAYAARAGALVTGVDLMESAVNYADQNLRLNGLKGRFVQANAFDYLESIAPNEEPFDWIVLDPPAIAKTRSGHDSLKWGIWKLVHRALMALKPGGHLVVCNCSYQLTLAETVDICRLAASDRGRKLFIEGTTYQDVDHPATVQFPESLYLKCLWLRS